MSFSILTFKKNYVSSGFTAYPINELDESYYNEHGKPPSGKYAKMLRRATPIADEIWDQILEVQAKMHDFPFLTRFPITNRLFECVVEHFAALDIELQDLKKVMKKSNQEQELNVYYSQYQEYYDVNVFDMMVKDLEQLLGAGQELNLEYRNKNSLNPELTITIDELKEYYKPALKKAKEAKKELLKKRNSNG